MKLARAIQAAEDRKQAALGDARPGIHYTAGELMDRSIFSGFDLEYGELVDASRAMGVTYHAQALTVPILPLFISAWVDGLLVGLMAATLPEESDNDGASS